MFKKAVGIIAVICVCMFALVGCGNPYHATLYDYANDWIDPAFLSENLVVGYYPNDDYVAGVSDENDKYVYVYDTEAPYERTFVIKDEARFRSIFTNYAGSPDFKKKVVILYIFTDCTPGKYYLNRTDLNSDRVLYIYVSPETYDYEETMDYQRCFMVTMDKAKFDNVIFEQV